LLYPVGNSSALASTIRDVINDHTLGRVLATTAYKMVKSHYSFETARSANLRAFDLDDVAVGDGQLVLR
jgi:hypothetical protein